MATPIDKFQLDFFGFTEGAKKKVSSNEIKEKKKEEIREKKDNDKVNDEISKKVVLHTLTSVELTETGFTYYFTDEIASAKITKVDTDKKETTITTTVTEEKFTIKYTVATTAALSISETSTEVTLGSVKVKTCLDYITFNRQLYKPNEIIADIQITASDNNTISMEDLQILLKTKVNLSLQYNYTENNKTTSTTKSFTSFYVYKILPLKKANKDLYVRLYIYSLDHQLTLKKYSRTYVAKKLVTDILLAKSSSNPKAFEFNSIPSALKWPFKATEYTDKSDGVRFFDHLCYTYSGKQYERIQPYLVQYNESFYDFMVRTANRCGEFFFWEDGQLQLGRLGEMNDIQTEVDKLDLSKISSSYSLTLTNEEIEEKNCTSIYFSHLATLTGDQSCDTDFLTLDDLNNCDEETKNLIEPKLNFSNDDKEKNNVNPLPNNTKYLFNDEINHDVYRTRLYKDKFESPTHAHRANTIKYVVSYFSRILHETSLFNILKKITAFEPVAAIIGAIESVNTNNYYNKANFDEDSCPNKQERTSSEDTSKWEDTWKYIAPFTTEDKKGHLDSDFYNNIRQNEESLSRQLITFNISNIKSPLKLGQLVSYNEKTYAVVQIKINVGSKSVSNFSGVDPASETEFQNLDGAIMQVIAIPVTKDSQDQTITRKYKINENETKTITIKVPSYIVYPPLHPAGHVRHSEPQVAFVSDYLDPQKRGRVRITYPWQHKDDTEASPWIRVLTPSATPGSGCSFELEKGDEVLVNYESNNIERPYVAGTLYNRNNGVSPRGDMTLISKNGHGIAFDDPIDSFKFLEGISPAYAFLRQLLPVWEIGGSDELKLTGGTTISDAYGFYKIQMSTDQRKIDIASPFGTVNIDAFTGITISAPNGDINIKGQNINIEAGNAVKITSGTNIEKKNWWGDFTGLSKGEVVGKTLSSIVEGWIEYFDPIASFIDVNLLRKTAEVFLRPIDGTLEIKSHQYLLLEAGKGKADIQRERYKQPWIIDDKKDVYVMITALRELYNFINTTIDNKATAINTKRTDCNTAMTAYSTAQNTHGAKLADTGLTAQSIIDQVFSAKQRTAYDANNIHKAQNVADDDADLGTIITAANTLDEKALDYYQEISGSENELTTRLTTWLNGNQVSRSAILYGNLIKTADVPDVLAQGNTHNPNMWKTVAGAVDAAFIKKLKRIWFNSCFDNIKSNVLTSSTSLTADTSSWQQFVNGLKEADVPAKGAFDSIGEAGSNFTKSYVDVIKNDGLGHWFHDRDHWEANKEGQIILSDQKAQSFLFNKNGTQIRYPNRRATSDTDRDILKNLKRELQNWN